MQPTSAKPRMILRREHVQRLGLPVTDQDVEALALDELDTTRALVQAQKWHSGPGSLLVMSGTPGIGKTVAAALLLLEHGGRYVRALDVARLFLAQFGDEIGQRQKLVECTGLLVVDDIGTERSVEAMQVALFELLDARRRDGRRSLWITNLARAAFEQRYGDPRLLSRLAQSALWFVQAGDDLRRK